MANQTDSRAKQVHGGNPQSIVDQMVRNRIYSNIYWKEKLAGANAEDIVDRALELKYIGGTYGGNRKPTKFLCLVLKLLQIQPEKRIIYTIIENEKYKYLRLLGLAYLRLIGTPEEIYTVCEKLTIDGRKAIVRVHDGSFKLEHVDEIADKLLREEVMFDIVLPRLTKRDVLEEMGKIGPKVSPLEAELDALLAAEENKSDEAALQGLSEGNKRKDSSSEDESRDRSRHKEINKSKSNHKDERSSSEEDSRSHSKKPKKEKKDKRDKKDKKEKKEQKKLKKMIKESKKHKNRSPSPVDKTKKPNTEEYWKALREQQGLKPI